MKKFLLKPVILWGSLIASLVLTALFALWSKDLPEGITFMSLQFASSQEAFTEVLLTLGDSGVLLYKKVLIQLDILYPVSYALFLSSLMLKVSKEKPGSLFVLPLVAGVCDLIENSLHLFLLGDFGMPSTFFVLLSYTFTCIKWVLILVSTTVIIKNIVIPAQAGI